MSSTATKAKVSVAGGISVKTIDEYKKYAPDVVIVGSGITHAENSLLAAAELKNAIK